MKGGKQQNKMTEQIERKIISLIAADRIDIPISSMSGKLKRMKPKLAGEIDLRDFAGNFHGERAYARLEDEEGMKARGMSEGIKQFEEQYPQYGKILRGMIAEERACREPTLYFGMQVGCRLTSSDYMQVMTDLGFSEQVAEGMYQNLMDASRNISRKRVDEERKILVG
jgi:hypothetical protein